MWFIYTEISYPGTRQNRARDKKLFFFRLNPGYIKLAAIEVYNIFKESHTAIIMGIRDFLFENLITPIFRELILMVQLWIV